MAPGASDDFCFSLARSYDSLNNFTASCTSFGWRKRKVTQAAFSQDVVAFDSSIGYQLVSDCHMKRYVSLMISMYVTELSST
jgi:hypothetical protein